MNKYQLYALAAILCFLVFACKQSSGNASGESQNTIEKLFEKGEDITADPKVREASIDSAYSIFSSYDNDSITRFFYRRATVAYYDLYKYDKSLHTSHKVYRMGEAAGEIGRAHV